MTENENERGVTFTPKVEKEIISTDINEIVLNSKGGFSADDEEYENKTEAPSVKSPEELKVIAKEIEEEVKTEVATEEITSVSGETEPKELTEEEKHAKFIQALKDSHNRYHPKKQFGAAYKQKRKAKNKMQSKSRKLSRKK